ncbi:hypothetical protein, partial [Ralstonia solanacearum species complex bacterium KE055]|uniref:hypothetical protein n=1 Tax=Ralstonia solanacearum species complex bacterium KE055 TaxID=3119586 RepID=UPI002FC3B485
GAVVFHRYSVKLDVCGTARMRIERDGVSETGQAATIDPCCKRAPYNKIGQRRFVRTPARHHATRIA